MHPIYTSAVVLLDSDGRVLTVRKRGTERFMLVGGKPEPGEQPRATALRETIEEVGLHFQPEDLELLGLWQAPAANEPDRDVHSTVFVASVPVASRPAAGGEIIELRWLDPTLALPGDLAPQLETRILPALMGHPPAWDVGHLPADEFGDPGPLRDRLLTALRSGDKTATSSRLADHQGEPLPQPGRLARVVDSGGVTVGITETISVEVKALGDIDEAFARAEGEGFATVAAWRAAHEEFWRGALPDDEPIVCERLRFHACGSDGASP